MIVPYGKGQDVISELNSEKAMYNFVYAKEVIKQATGYTVTCYQYQIEKLKEGNKDTAVIYNDYFGIYILNDSAYYDDKLGLNLDAIGGEGVFY